MTTKEESTAKDDKPQQPTIKYIHLRCHNQYGDLLAKGGVTIAYTIDGNIVNYAFAKCNKHDHFDRRVGRVKAAGRLSSLVSTTIRHGKPVRNWDRVVFSKGAPLDEEIFSTLKQLYYQAVREYVPNVAEIVY